MNRNKWRGNRKSEHGRRSGGIGKVKRKEERENREGEQEEGEGE